MQRHFLYIFLFISYLGIAQTPITYTTKNGLPSNHIYDIQEDENGFMWFATNRGLVKYDGETFKTFTIKDGLPNNDTWLLDLDYQDRLWYASRSNYQGYIKNDSIYKFPVVDNTVISPFLFKSNHTMLYYSSIGYLTLQNDVLKDSDIVKESYLKLGVDIFKKAYETIGVIEGKDYSSYNPKMKELIGLSNKEIIFFNEKLSILKKNKVPITLSTADKKIKHGFGFNYISYYKHKEGILFVNYKTKDTKYYTFKDLINTKNIDHFRFNSLKNHIQISVPGHLLIFDYHLQLQEKYAFSNTLGRQSYKDSKGNIWLIDFTNGVSLIPNSQVQTTNYLKNKKVKKINKIDGILYAGVNEDGFYKFNNSSKTFNGLIDIERENGQVHEIDHDSLNRIFFVSSANIFIKKNKTINTIKLGIKLAKWSATGNYKNAILYKKNCFFISGNYVLQTDIDFNNIKIAFIKDGLFFNTIYKNNLYFGGSDGLLQYKNDTLVKAMGNHQLLNVSVSNLLTSTEYLFVGTDGRGAYVYNEDKVTHLKNTDGFSIQKIIKKEDNLWIATQKGVHQIKLNKNDISNSTITNSFYESDGLLQNNTNDIYVDKDTLYAATDIGIAKINVNDTIYKQQTKPYFKTKNDTLNYSGESRDNISVTFGLHDYVNQDYVKYQYRLSPTQKKWTTTKTKILNFANLSPKLYQLEVKATDQHFNQTIVKQYLDVKPSWYQTNWAKVLFALIAILTFVAFTLMVKKTIRKSEQKRNDRDKKVAGLELQALRSQMNPHFVHNSLNAIQYYIQRTEVELSENYLSKFSKLIRMFFEYSRRDSIKLNEEIELITHYLDIEKLRFEDKLSYQINVDNNLDIEEQLIPSMILQPIIENAVNHGVFHKKTNGLIKVSFDALANGFKIVIEDDGIGIHKAKEIYKNSTKNYQSKSSAVLHERLELLGQSDEWEIEHTIVDLSDISEEQGTRVTLNFKTGNQWLK